MICFTDMFRLCLKKLELNVKLCIIIVRLGFRSCYEMEDSLTQILNDNNYILKGFDCNMILTCENIMTEEGNYLFKVIMTRLLKF